MSQDAPSAQTPSGVTYRPLRTWIPILLLLPMAIVRFLPDWIPNAPSNIWMASAFGPFLIGLLIVIWWLALSRANWSEKLLGLSGIVAIIVVEQFLCHPSMRGPLLIVMTIPMAILGFAIGTILFGRWMHHRRTFVALAISAILALVSVAVKSDGVWGNFAFELDPRWAPSSEDRLLAVDHEKVAADISENDLANPAWPAFRGLNQNGSQSGSIIDDDWKTHPPKELWRIPVGPAWSSFVVAGDFLFTQEQRGDNEAIVCYNAKSGQQAWEHLLESRFWDGLGGLGPRATPTLAQGSVFAQGAEGWLVKLDARSGTLAWKVDLKQAANREPPMWGFSASPCVVNDQVIIHAGGEGEKGILAFQVADGSLAWSAPAGIQSYGSVQKIELLGRPMLSLLSEEGIHFWEPSTGKPILMHEWKHGGYRALQPQVLDNDKVLIGSGMGTGTRLIQVAEVDGSLNAEVLWTSKEMKPDYNDSVVHQGFLYGFDNRIFSCIDLATGKTRWKGGRYEKGQALLLADSNLIVVVSETGELILLRATPDKLDELYKQQTIEGKTWNHPILIGDKLYLRNANEAVCLQLPIKANIASSGSAP